MLKTENSPTFYRTDYQAPNFAIQSVFLDFSLNPIKTIVQSTLKITRLSPGPLVLKGEDLELLSLLVNGQAYRYFELHAKELVLHDLPNEFDLEITCSNNPLENTSLMGLYVSSGNFFTQCEAEGFRKITYFLDQPDVLTLFTVKLTAAKKDYPILLSNGNLIQEEELSDDRHSATWEDPFPKPSYLFAIVAGQLSVLEKTITTQSGKEKLLQIWVEKKDLSKTQHAMDSLIKAITWDENRFGLELDLDRFMIVAVGDFNMGAMENKGLNIFNTKYVLADPNSATDIDFANIESVVGHEYFHNWTGNRVTCKDWFQLSLKEGLTVFRDQEFSADLMGSESGKAVKRIEDVRLLRQIQFPEDAGPMAHPIRPDSYQEINNFYTVTVYEKGAEVVRMQHTLLGEPGFRKGMDLYFQRHDGQAVTCDDFVSAMSDANAIDLEQFKNWYSQAGTPQVAITENYNSEDQTYTINLSQYCPPTPNQAIKKPFHIPLKTKLLIEHQQTQEFLIELKEVNQTICLEKIPRKPILSINRDFSAPVILQFTQSTRELIYLFQYDDNPFNQWEAGQQLALQAILNNSSPSQELISVWEQLLLDDRLDPAYREIIFTLPAETYLHEQCDRVNPLIIHSSKKQFQSTLAKSLKKSWQETYEKYQTDEPYQANAQQAGKRALKNFALQMLIADDLEFGSALAEQQFKTCHNMTDRLAALTALVHHASLHAAPCLEIFYEQYKNNDLALDKWFAIQATVPPRENFALVDHILQLKQHPAFKINNPNRTRSLIHAFCLNNPAGFHDEQGRGYGFWIACVKELNAINPQVAARLARGLDRWKKFASPFQEMMHSTLAELAQQNLSSDVAEIIHKALSTD